MPYKATWDWAVVLQELAVVDVDDASADQDLASRFSELSAAPSAVTKRGHHYYFTRTIDADARGFFDGAGQVQHGVDFKTRCSSGTGGIILVTPSTDKGWLRAPWIGQGPQPISTALLLAVAVPSELAPEEGEGVPPAPVVGVPVSKAPLCEAAAASVAPLAGPPSLQPPHPAALTLTFEDPTELPLTIAGEELRLLLRSEYIITLLSGRWAVGPTQSIMGTRGGMVGLLSILMTGSLPAGEEPTPRILAAMETVAESLLLPAELRARCSVPSMQGRLTFEADLYALSTEWWRLSRDEEARLREEPDASEAALLRVDAALARVVVSRPVSKATRPDAWLMAELPQSIPPGHPLVGREMMHADPEENFNDELPQTVKRILIKHRSCLCLAGGFVLGAVCPFVERGSDLDLFLWGLDEECAKHVLQNITADLRATHDITISSAAVTFTCKPKLKPKLAKKAAREKEEEGEEEESEEEGEKLAIQIVMGLHHSRGEIVEHFDLACCKILAYAVSDDEDEPLVVQALPSFCASLSSLSVWVDPAIWSECSTSRIFKYIAKVRLGG